MSALSTDEVVDLTGISERILRCLLADRMIPEPEYIGDFEPGPRKHTRHYLALRWSPDDLRIIRLVASLTAYGIKGSRQKQRRLGLLGINWQTLGALIRSHPSAGWLIVTDDGALTFTESPEEAAAVQCSARLSVCVRVEAE